MYVAYIGKLFLRMLKALILPLIIPSLIAAIGQLDMSLSGKIGGRAIAYYMSTTVLAVILGIILVTSIQPGAEQTATEGVEGVNALDFTYISQLKHKITCQDTFYYYLFLFTFTNKDWRIKKRNGS